MAESEIAQFRQRQALQEDAAHQGLSGLAAGVARHDFIESRMARDAQPLINQIAELVEENKSEEALILLKSWETNMDISTHHI